MENVDVENVCAEEAKKAGTADFIIAVENQRAIKVSSSTKFNFSHQQYQMAVKTRYNQTFFTIMEMCK